MDDKTPNLKYNNQNNVDYYIGNSQYTLDNTIINQSFYDQIILSNTLTHYVDTVITTNVDVKLGPDPRIGGSAEIRMIGNGTNTPLFTAFVKSSSSVDYSPTLAAINKVVFYYDGTSAFYSITVL